MFLFQMNIYFVIIRQVKPISLTSMATSTVEFDKAQFAVPAVHESIIRI